MEVKGAALSRTVSGFFGARKRQGERTRQKVFWKCLLAASNVTVVIGGKTNVIVGRTQRQEVLLMIIGNCKLLVLILALVAGGIVGAPPTVSAQANNIANDGLFGMADDNAVATTTLPVLWTAGGLSAGTNSAGQSARIASDTLGNIAVVSGPANARDLAVTSYTASGTLRWRRTITPSSGTFVGDWVVAVPNGELIAIGHNQDSHGRPIQSTMVRYDSNGTLLWRVDFSSGFYPVVGRLVVDSAGSAYLTWSATGSGLFVQKYSPSGILLWSQGSSNGGIYAIATSLALSPDETDVIATGDISGGAMWITASFNTTTGVPRWEVSAPEGIANLDVVVDATRVYVTGEGNVGTSGFLTVVAYDRATGARLWRTDANPPVCCAYATRIAKAPDGSLVVAGRASTGGYFDWWIVSLNTNGTVRWQTRRDAALSGDEMPAVVFVLADGTTVVSGVGGPVTHDPIGNSYMQGVTAGYSPNGTLLWEAFSRLPTVWAAPLPTGDVCATGGYDALITCFDIPGGITPIEPVAIISATPTTGTAPLNVAFDGRSSTGPNTLTAWNWTFGDGGTGSGSQISHLYSTPGTFTASLVVTDTFGLSSLPRTVSIVINIAPTPPSAPINLTTDSRLRNTVGLIWTNTSTTQTEVKIERCKGVGCTNFVQIATVAGTATNYADLGLAGNTYYRYRVRAANASGNSPYSNSIGVRTTKR
ncbi:hypothetical protein BH10ACI3_BH10ACI3_00350 [soil metagenome]